MTKFPVMSIEVWQFWKQEKLGEEALMDRPYLLAYELLGEILTDLQEAPEIKASPILSKRVGTAIDVFHQLPKHFENVLSGYSYLQEELAKIKRNLPDSSIQQQYQEIKPKYEIIQQAGGDAKLIYKVAKADGLDKVNEIKLLRSLFTLSLVEAQSIINEIDNQDR
jgi:hypothetical protein